MTKKDFEKIVDEIFSQCKDVLITKGREYQSNVQEGVNVFANFERGANLTGVNRETILFVYLSKHYDSISTYIKDQQLQRERKMTEPIDGRIIDAINYLILLYGMVQQKKRSISAKPPNIE